MQDRTINSALLHLRVQLVRENRPGLEHVEAPLRLRRVPLHEVKRAPREAFDRRELRRELATLLGDGPLTSRQIADRVQEAHGLTRTRARDTVKGTLGNMRRAGWVRLEDGLWELAAVRVTSLRASDRHVALENPTAMCSDWLTDV